MKKTRFIFSQNPSGKGKNEKLFRENEALRNRLKELTGSDVRWDDDKLPPDIENLLLKNIVQLEEGYGNAALVSVYEFLGRPSYPKVEELDDQQLEKELAALESLLFSHNILLDLAEMEDNREKYTCITEVFFHEKIRNIQMSGLFYRFHVAGEETVKNPDQAIEETGARFLNSWSNRAINELEAMLGNEFILEDGTVLSRETVLHKFRLMFESFTEFRNWKYAFHEVKHEFKGGDMQGVGLVNGYVAYDVVLESGELQHFEGPFIVFMSFNRSGCRLFYFVFPGFKW